MKKLFVTIGTALMVQFAANAQEVNNIAVIEGVGFNNYAEGIQADTGLNCVILYNHKYNDVYFNNGNNNRQKIFARNPYKGGVGIAKISPDMKVVATNDLRTAYTGSTDLISNVKKTLFGFNSKTKSGLASGTGDMQAVFFGLNGMAYREQGRGYKFFKVLKRQSGQVVGNGASINDTNLFYNGGIYQKKKCFIGMKKSYKNHTYWHKEYSSTGDIYGQGIAHDKLENTYSLITYKGKPSGGLKNLAPVGTAANNNAMGLVKHDNKGNVKWAYTFKFKSGTGFFQGKQGGIVTDKANNVYVTISYFGDILQYRSTTFPFASKAIGLLLKLNPNGDILWYKAYKASGNVYMNRTAIGPCNKRIYVGGMYKAEFKFNGKTIADKNGGGSETPIVLCLDTAGKEYWATPINPKNKGFLSQIAISKEGMLYATGYNSGTISFNGNEIKKGNAYIARINTWKSFKTSPINNIECSGNKVNLSADWLNGGIKPANLKYIWYINGLKGKTNNNTLNYTYTAPALVKFRLDSTKITAVAIASNGCFASASKVAISTIHDLNPIIAKNGNILKCIKTFQSYQWYKNNVKINGKISQIFTITGNGIYKVVVTKNGCSQSSNKIGLGIGIKSINKNPVISFYPNPTHGITTIKVNSTIKLNGSIYNAMGQKMKDVTINNQSPVDISELPAGYYILNIKGKNINQNYNVLKL